VGLIARAIEARGLQTVYIGLMLDIVQRIRPPRAVFLDFPLGHPVGKPFDRQLQLSILRDALAFLETARPPADLLKLSYGWGEPFTYVPGSAAKLQGQKDK
jgi:D-proline reductase (dithiol) PrdB